MIFLSRVAKHRHTHYMQSSAANDANLPAKRRTLSEEDALNKAAVSIGESRVSCLFSATHSTFRSGKAKKLLKCYREDKGRLDRKNDERFV